MRGRPVAARVRALAQRRGLRWLLVVAAGLGALSALLPLAGVPGYESALIANVLVGLLGGVVGITAARIERATSPRPVASGGAGAVVTASLTVTSFAGIVPPLLTSLLVGALGGACSLTAGLPFYLVLPLPSALLACALGVLIGALAPSTRSAGVVLVLVVVGSLACSLAPVLWGPQVFVYDHLLGFLPGPLYDEVVQLEPPLLAFRAITLALGVAVVGLVGLTLRTRHRTPLRSLLLLLIGGAVAIVGHASGEKLGFAQSEEGIEAQLGARAEGERCTIIFPRELAKERVDLLLSECELHVEQLERFFGTEAHAPTVFLYRSREEKRRLVGASRTQFAKPWLDQLHIDDRGWPHPVLKHELAHVIAGSIGSAPFGVTAVFFGLLPVQGLIEGAAVAADWPPGELTVHEQAHALRELGLAPSLPSILSARGFFAEAPRRAYTYAGSFVRWLVEQRGAAAFRTLYAAGDFSSAYGVPLDELLGEWQAFLDDVPLDDQARALAARRFRRPALFRRPCAREVAALDASVDAAIEARDPSRAAELLERCIALDEHEPAHLARLIGVRARQGRLEDAHALFDRLSAQPAVDELLRGTAAAQLGAAHARAGDLAGARLAYELAAAAPLDRAGERTIAIVREALADPALAAVVLPFLSDGEDGQLFAIRELLVDRPDYASGWYLLGRRLVALEAPAQAIAYLDRALAGTLPDEPIAREARRLRAIALLQNREYIASCAAFGTLSEEGRPGERLEAQELLALCRFHAERMARRTTEG